MDDYLWTLKQFPELDFQSKQKVKRFLFRLQDIRALVLTKWYTLKIFFVNVLKKKPLNAASHTASKPLCSVCMLGNLAVSLMTSVPNQPRTSRHIIGREHSLSEVTEKRDENTCACLQETNTLRRREADGTTFLPDTAF